MLTLGNLLVVASFLTDRPISVLFAAAGLLVLVPQAVYALRAWRQTRQTSGEPR